MVWIPHPYQHLAPYLDLFFSFLLEREYRLLHSNPDQSNSACTDERLLWASLLCMTFIHSFIDRDGRLNSIRTSSLYSILFLSFRPTLSLILFTESRHLPTLTNRPLVRPSIKHYQSLPPYLPTYPSTYLHHPSPFLPISLPIYPSTHLPFHLHPFYPNYQLPTRKPPRPIKPTPQLPVRLDYFSLQDGVFDDGFAVLGPDAGEPDALGCFFWTCF